MPVGRYQSPLDYALQYAALAVKNTALLLLGSTPHTAMTEPPKSECLGFWVAHLHLGAARALHMRPGAAAEGGAGGVHLRQGGLRRQLEEVEHHVEACTARPAVQCRPS